MENLRSCGNPINKTNDSMPARSGELGNMLAKREEIRKYSRYFCLDGCEENNVLKGTRIANLMGQQMGLTKEGQLGLYDE
jgi:hypothetical protein